MLKNLVGEWGSGLPDGDYACAIAALGVLESRGTLHHRPTSDPLSIVAALREEFLDGERTPTWRGGSRSSRVAIQDDAVALAAGWRMYVDPLARWRQEQHIPYHERGRPRLAIPSSWRSDAGAFESLIEWLRHADVQLSALVLDDGHSTPGVAWHWPLRVGVPEGAENAAIIGALRQARSAWVADLSQCFTVGRGRDHCDLLVVSYLGASRVIEEGRTRIRASMVAVVGEVTLSSDAAAERCSILRARVRAGGAAVITLPVHSQGMLEDWYREIIRELSHDVPVHAALTRATQGFDLPKPVIVGSPRALDACRLRSIADRHDEIDAALARRSRRRTRGVRRGPDWEPTFGGPREPLPGQRPLTASLGDLVRSQDFTSEEHGKEMARRFSQRESTQSEVRRPRWIQANVWRKGVEGPAPSLEPAQWNVLSVHIGPSVTPLPYTPFLDERVNFARGDVDVTVQVELANAALKSLGEGAESLRRVSPPSFAASIALGGPVSEFEHPSFDEEEQTVGLAAEVIVLPKIGDSSLAMFAVHPAPKAEKVEGRISLIHNNRVIQTARASINVSESQSVNSGLTLVTGTLIHPRDDDLDERREGDVHIRVSDIGGKLHLTIGNDNGDKQVQLDDLTDSMKAIAEAIKQAAIRWDYSKSLGEQPQFAESLYPLAAHGSLLEQHLREKCGPGIESWERVQLVQETNTFFPVEWVYDGTPPESEAVVCPNAARALDSGACHRALGAPNVPEPCPHRGDGAFLCPMHFWGFRRVIERNTETTPLSAAAKGIGPAVKVPADGPYGPVTGVLFAASDRAFQYAVNEEAQRSERASLVSALNVFSSIPLADAADWKEWKDAAKQKRNLLVLVPHADQFRNAPALEIGKQKWLGKQEINKSVSGYQGDPQILLLLGCSTASVSEDFQPYPKRFLDARVSMVLASVAAIRGADAVPIVKRMTEHLADALESPEPSSFGELLPLLRRQLLREGHPGVMSIVGFGDGDWLIGGA